MRAMGSWVGMVVVTLLAPGTVRAEEPKEVLAKLSKTYDAAIKARDVKVLGQLFDEGGRFINDEGHVFDKKGYIAEMVKDTTYESSASTDVTIRVIGNTAIETGMWTGKGKKDGKPFLKKNRYTTVWVKKGDTWVVTAEQSTPIAAAR